MTAPRLSLEEAGDFILPVLRRGPEAGALVIFVQPLLEELNRCRRLFRDLGSALADRGIQSALADLPRTGDHPDLEPFDLELAKGALQAFLGAQPNRDIALVSVRSGAFLVPSGETHFSIAPVRKGERVLAELVRTHAIGEKERTGRTFRRDDLENALGADGRIALAGYVITGEFSAQLHAAEAAELLEVEPGYNSVPVWRQADPADTRADAENYARWIADRMAGQ